MHRETERDQNSDFVRQRARDPGDQMVGDANALQEEEHERGEAEEHQQGNGHDAPSLVLDAN